MNALNEEKFDMSFEEAQEFISTRGFDVLWNDGDVFVDEREITRTVANVLKWSENQFKKRMQACQGYDSWEEIFNDVFSWTGTTQEVKTSQTSSR